MDVFGKNSKNKYERVMARVNNQVRSKLNSSSLITRHQMPSSVRVGAKPSVSNVSSSVYSELPIVLNDYVPEVTSTKPKRTFVSKPKRTLKSLDPELSPPRTVIKSKGFSKRGIHVPDSAPTVLPTHREKWTDKHLRTCQSSRSHCRLIELKDEIQAYHETEKLMKVRSSLFKKCGVVLNDVGNVAADKAVQVEDLAQKADDTSQTEIR